MAASEKSGHSEVGLPSLIFRDSFGAESKYWGDIRQSIC